LGRDRDVRNAIQTTLLATGQFDTVWMTGLSEDYGQGADELRAVAIDPVNSSERDDWDSSTAGGVLIQSTVTIMILVRHIDPQLRDEAAELLLDTVANTLNGQSLAGLTLPPWTRITNWRWLDATAPERRIQATLQYSYIVEGWENFDTTP
jgi:hypothetical protein